MILKNKYFSVNEEFCAKYNIIEFELKQKAKYNPIKTKASKIVTIFLNFV